MSSRDRKRVSFGASQVAFYHDAEVAVVTVPQREPLSAPKLQGRVVLGEMTNTMRTATSTNSYGVFKPPLKLEPPPAAPSYTQRPSTSTPRPDGSPFQTTSSFASPTISTSPRITVKNGLVTAVALFGMPRAGSAWLFNALRLVLRMEGQDVRADWDSSLADKFGGGDLGSAIKTLKSNNTSALIKSLQCNLDMLRCCDRSFVCVRDLRQAVASEMERRGQLAAPAAEWIAKAQGFARMCNAAESAARDVPGHMFRMTFEQLVRDPIGLFGLIAEHLGHPKLPVENAEAGVEQLAKTVELEGDRNLEGLAGVVAIENDPECRRWLISHGYYVRSQLY